MESKLPNDFNLIWSLIQAQTLRTSMILDVFAKLFDNAEQFGCS